VPRAELTTEPSLVVHANSGRRLSYGEIVALADIPAIAPHIKPQVLKKAATCQLIAQSQGGIVYGLGLALSEEISIRDGAVVQSNFDDYTVMRLSDVSDIHVELIATDNQPTGVGQMPVTVVAPAIGNAVARLTGVRLRETPMTPERVKKALG
jgi:Molybdopterin cofactor-binding domain